MSREYTATAETLYQIATQPGKEQQCVSSNEFKQSFIRSIKKSSTELWNPGGYDEQDESVYTDEYTYCKYNTADNKQRLQRHLNDDFARSKLVEYGWLTNNTVVDIEYKINRHGFRCDNFNNDPGIIFVGCSHTYGTGLPVPLTWASIVSSYFNKNCWNLGLPGLSATPSTFYLLNWYNDIPNPSAIVLLEPPAGRIELYRQINENININILGTLLESSEPGPLTNKLYHMLELTSAINYRTAALSLQLLAKTLNIPFVHTYLNKVEDLGKHNDFARDLMHVGANTHAVIADHVIHELKKAGLV